MNSEDEKIIARRIAEKSFHVNMPRVLRLLIAFGEVLLSHSAILCYFAMVLNTLMSGSILSLLFPISIFFWAMLSVPRPKKSYWVTIITYTEVRLVVALNVLLYLLPIFLVSYFLFTFLLISLRIDPFIFTVRRLAKRGICRRRVSVCLSVCVCVCVCVCLSHSGIVSKRLNVGSRK